jgi:hypothetical protein
MNTDELTDTVTLTGAVPEVNGENYTISADWLEVPAMYEEKRHVLVLLLC